MKIGLMSDTHDHLEKIREALSIFETGRVEFVLHAGDFVAPFSLVPLQSMSCEWIGVFGNNDGEKQGLQEKSLGKIKPPPLFLDLHSKKIALLHQFQDVEADIIVYGHTHESEIKQEQDKLIINPGEVCGWLTTRSSVVILDLINLKPEIVYF